MSFLSIAFLAGLPLAVAPILLHLFDRRRHVVIEWGAMQFLMEATTRKTSARKLKQWLLLLMRVLAILALVLSLARPMLPGDWFGATDRGETIIVIDNSMSMARQSDDATLLDAAREKASEAIGRMKMGDFVRVMTASPYPRWETDGGTRLDTGTHSVVLDQLAEVRATNGSSDLLSSIFTAVQAEVQPTVRHRDVLVVTDGQAVDWSIEDQGGWKRIQELLGDAPIQTKVEVVEVPGPPDDSNLAIDNVRANRTVVGVDQTFILTAKVHNHGSRSSSSTSIAWQVGDEELHSGELPSVEGGTSRDVVWRHSFSEPGVYAVSCLVDAGDRLAADDVAAVVIEVVEEVPIVLVESSPEMAEVQRDAFLVEAALGYVDGEPLSETGVFVPTVVQPDELARLDLRPYRAVVIPNFTTIDAETSKVLEGFVREGGGLWIATGPRTEIDAFNQRCFADGNGVAPLALNRIVSEERPPGTGGRGGERTTIDPLLRTHPATTQLSDGGQLDTADVVVTRRFSFRSSPFGEDVSELLGLTNGSPLAVEKYLGRGRVIVLAVPLKMEWSDLARSQCFVVMVRDWLDYITQPRATRHNLSPGDPIAVHLAQADSRFATLTTPSGDEVELAGEPAGDGMVFRSGRTIMPGRYTFESGLSGDRISFEVSRDPDESTLKVLSQEERVLLGTLDSVSQAGTAALAPAGRSEPLWPALLFILIGLIAGELILAGMISKERFGSDPISDTVGPTSPLTRTVGESQRSIRSSAEQRRPLAESVSEESVSSG